VFVNIKLTQKEKMLTLGLFLKMTLLHLDNTGASQHATLQLFRSSLSHCSSRALANAA